MAKVTTKSKAPENEEEQIQVAEPSKNLSATLEGSFSDPDITDIGLDENKESLTSIPVLKLTQQMSPEVTSREYPDIYAGMFINAGTREILGESVEVRVMRAWRCRVKYYPRDTASTGIECSCPTYTPTAVEDMGSEYGRCRTCQFNNFDMEERCQVQFHMVVALNDNPNQLYRVILSKTSYKAGTKLERALKSVASRIPNVPVFMFKVKLFAKEVTNPRRRATYYVFDVDVEIPETEADLLAADLRKPFIEKFKEITSLRQEAIDNHRSYLADKAEAEANKTTAGPSAFDSMADTVNENDSFGLEEEAKIESADDGEVPF